jgi:hypothetical protein
MDSNEIKAHKLKYSKHYESGVLSVEHHNRLVEDIDNIAAQSNILTKSITTRMDAICSLDEITWVQNFRAHKEAGTAGLAYVGKIDKVTDRMMLIAGACIRNFIDARLYTIQEVVEGLKTGDLYHPRVMLIPNFHISKEVGGGLPSWQISQLLGFLMNRYTAGNITILYIHNMKILASEYGSPVENLIREHYKLIEEK